MRHRRPAQCRQVDALQCADADRGGAGGQLSVLHHRAQCRRGRGAGPAPRHAGRDRQLEGDHPDPAHLRRHRRTGARRLARAKGSATSFSPTFASATRSPMSCAASRTATSPMSRAASIRCRDIATIETELMLADLDSLERRIGAMEKKAKGGDKEAKEFAGSRRAQPRRAARGPAGARSRRQPRGARPVPVARPLVVEARALCLQRRGGLGRRRQRLFREGRGAGREGGRGRGGRLGQDRERDRRPAAGRADGLSRGGRPDEPGLNRVIRAGYDLLHLVTFFTVGPKEARAWTIEQGHESAPQAAGVIHTDFEKGFIRAETIAYDDYVACRGEAGAREAGKFRLEGKDYAVADGDVLAFPLRELTRWRPVRNSALRRLGFDPIG